MTVIAPDQLAETVVRRMESGNEPLSVFWFSAIEGPRDPFAEELRQGVEGAAVIVHVLRSQHFTNPNGYAEDVCAALNAERDSFTRVCAGRDRAGLVLLARGELDIPGGASPALLPEWCDLQPGRECHTRFHNLTKQVDASLNAVEFRASELAESLYRLDREVCLALSHKADSEPDAVAAFIEAIRPERMKPAGKNWREILREANELIREIDSVTGFRPSRQEPWSISAMIWEWGVKEGSDKHRKLAKKLAKALGLDSSVQVRSQSIIAVMNRPSPSGGEEGPGEALLARQVLACWVAVCQLIVAAHHADDYARQPIQLLDALSADLLRALSEGREEIRIAREVSA